MICKVGMLRDYRLRTHITGSAAYVMYRATRGVRVNLLLAVTWMLDFLPDFAKDTGVVFSWSPAVLWAPVWGVAGCSYAEVRYIPPGDV